MDITILAIESSCDETSASVIQNGKVLNNIINSQSIHEKYGGVVPELASRAHESNIVPVVDSALQGAGINKKDLDAVAFTKGPGLMGALLVGISFAKGLSLGLNIPLIEVNHMKAHVLAHFIENPKPSFPFLCLTASGGHTQLLVVRDYLEMEVIGQTKDDAAGEAFDKSAKLLGLGYPGGPLIDKYAQEGDSKAFQFPLANVPNLDFSFSGIKTSILYFLRERLKSNPNFIEKNLADICASIQYTLIKMLLDKIIKAVKQTGIKEVAIAGGVSANKGLRKTLLHEAEKQGWKVFTPKFEYCTDNAAMIAITAHFKYLKGDFSSLNANPNPKMKV